MKIFILPFCLVVFLATGCVEPIPAPPQNLAEYSEIQRTHPQEYPTSTVKRHNIQRVLDPDLDVEQREASLELLSNLAGPGGQLPAEIAAVLLQKDCPSSLRRLVSGQDVSIAAANQTPATTGGTTRKPPVAAVSGQPGRIPLDQLADAPAGPQRTATLRWLVQNPKVDLLDDLAKLWALQPVNNADEQLFRQAVTKLGAGQWSDVLLNSINAKGFSARGSALSVLVARGAEINLFDRVKKMTAKNVSIQAMQTFVNKFGYMPANGGELLACVILQDKGQTNLNATAKLSRRWKTLYNYKFNIRDYHLVSSIAADPIRSKIGQNELIKQIVTSVGPRRHVAQSGTPFSQQASQMSMADLWNIQLLDKMLHQKRVSLALRILADRLRAGLNSPRSGLVFYENAAASAKLYPQKKDSVAGDRNHLPERELHRAGFDALCHLHTRFEKVYNGDVAPPSRQELSAARRANFCGLLLASIDSRKFSVFYYNPNGNAVSLGVFEFGK
ncbi:MAG: hypothetical protein HN350_02925 [Phycisphaerales bacterium]|nr:hypothetical protein [Phycisphaerales bacterium]